MPKAAHRAAASAITYPFLGLLGVWRISSAPRASSAAARCGTISRATIRGSVKAAISPPR